ncbi:hypothetical protein F4819DRAFT_128695 [Hypoxylon fuscum]|nr:hypothetical protein F4819DRAFT_128695 [Hypoxylon fuscum]
MPSPDLLICALHACPFPPTYCYTIHMHTRSPIVFGSHVLEPETICGLYWMYAVLPLVYSSNQDLGGQEEPAYVFWTPTVDSLPPVHSSSNNRGSVGPEVSSLFFIDMFFNTSHTHQSSSNPIGMYLYDMYVHYSSVSKSPFEGSATDFETGPALPSFTFSVLCTYNGKLG